MGTRSQATLPMERCTRCSGSGWVPRSVPIVVPGMDRFRGNPKHMGILPPDETEVIRDQQCGCRNGWRQALGSEVDHIRRRPTLIVLGDGRPDNLQKEA